MVQVAPDPFLQRHFYLVRLGSLHTIGLIVMDGAKESEEKRVVYCIGQETWLTECCAVGFEFGGPFSVITFECADQLLDVLEKTPPQLLVLTNSELPGLAGKVDALALLAQCRALHPKLACLWVTGLENREVEERLRSATERPDRVLAKPFLIDELLRAAQGLLGTCLPASRCDLTAEEPTARRR